MTIKQLTEKTTEFVMWQYDGTPSSLVEINDWMTAHGDTSERGLMAAGPGDTYTWFNGDRTFTPADIQVILADWRGVHLNDTYSTEAQVEGRFNVGDDL